MPEGANAATELRHEHEEIEGLVQQIASLEQCPERTRLIHEAADHYLAHAQAERKYLYPALRQYLPGGVDAAVEQFRRHQATERIVGSLWLADEDGEVFGALANQFVVDVQRHIEEQDTVLLPTLLDACPPEDFNNLGRQLRAGVKEALEERAAGRSAVEADA